MTTKEINEKLEKLTEEQNKVKAYVTKLAKKLIENNVKVPQTNWSKSTTEETNK